MSADMSNKELAEALSEFKKWLETPIDSFSKSKTSKKTGKGSKEKTQKVPKKDSKGRFIEEKSKTESMDEGSDSEEHKTDSSSGDESKQKPKRGKGKGKRAKEPTTHEQDTQDKFVHSRGKKQKQIVVEPIQSSQANKDGGGASSSVASAGSTAAPAKPAAPLVRGPRF